MLVKGATGDEYMRHHRFGYRFQLTRVGRQATAWNKTKWWSIEHLNPTNIYWYYYQRKQAISEMGLKIKSTLTASRP